MSKWILIAGMLALGGWGFDGNRQAAAQTSNPHGFTGPSVPGLTPLKGDYGNTGVKTSDSRTDIPALINALQTIHAKDYMALVWTEANYPHGWDDFQLMAPQFQQAGIRLWLYLAPPSETASQPYGSDYVAWATHCATIAQQYPIVAGLCIDDFCSSANHSTFTTPYLQSMMTAAHAIDPQLSLLVTCYYKDYTTTSNRNYLAPIIKAGAVDGVIFPYYIRESDNSCFTDTTQLQPELQTYRIWLDQQTTLGGFTDKMPLVTMVYASKLSFSIDTPTPAYVSTSLGIGLQATASGLADGVATYCLPKNDPAYLNAVASVYVPEPGTLVLLATASLGLLGYACAAWARKTGKRCPA